MSLSVSLESPTVAPVIAAPVIAMYKTARYAIDIAALAKAARNDIDAVATISVPAVVKRHRLGATESETPTLPEAGGGVSYDFVQVIAGIDARPVSVDNIVSFNSDPAWVTANHGIASVMVGCYFAVGWRLKADNIVLIYMVNNIEMYREGNFEDRSNPPVAALTCDLQGYSTSSWRGQTSSVPEYLLPLYYATVQRMSSDRSVPFYMEVIRMIKGTDEGRQVAERMKRNEIAESVETADSFMPRLLDEILDIRNNQYARLPASMERRRVEQLRGVETLEFDAENNSINLAVTMIRKTDAMPVMFKLRLTADNFCDSSGRMLLERGLVLNCTSYDRLRMELETRRDKIVVVNLLSLR